MHAQPRISSLPGPLPTVAAIETGIRFGRFTMLPDRKALLVDGAAVPIGVRAFDILQFLVTHRDRFNSRDQIREHVWRGLSVADNNVSVQIWRLRRCLSAAENGAPSIISVPVHGYRFVAPLAEADPADARPSAAPTRFVTRRLRPRLAVLAAVACLGLGSLVWLHPQPPGAQTQAVVQPRTPQDRIATLSHRAMWQEADDPDDANR